jgi:ABC-type sugar transport system substrate-binding protein
MSSARHTHLTRRQILGTSAGLAGSAMLRRWTDAAAQDATPVPIQGQIAFGQPDRTADVYKPLIAGAKLEGQARGYEVLESFAEGRADKQIAEINTWIGSGVKAMTILPLDEKAMQPAIEKAHAAGIVFVSYSDIIPNADGYTVFDSVQGGEMVGEWVGNWINENLGGEAEIASLTADFHETGRQRIGGAEKKIMELAPNVKIVNRTEAILAPEAFETTQSILQANPNLNVVLCIADDGCLGAAQAFAATDRDPNTVCIVGWDGSREVMKRIMDGGTPIRATGALDLLAIGRSAIWVPANILENKEPTNYTSKYELVTADTPELAQRLIDAYDMTAD